MIIRPVGAELFHPDETDVTQLIVGIRNFANVSKKL